MWKWKSDYYVMDMSLFSEEAEILLGDGCQFQVVSVEKRMEPDSGQLVN